MGSAAGGPCSLSGWAGLGCLPPACRHSSPPLLTGQPPLQGNKREQGRAAAGGEEVWLLVLKTPLIISEFKCSVGNMKPWAGTPLVHAYSLSPLLGTGSRQKPSASPPPSQKTSWPASLLLSRKALQSAWGLQERAQDQNEEEGEGSCQRTLKSGSRERARPSSALSMGEKGELRQVPRSAGLPESCQQVY